MFGYVCARNIRIGAPFESVATAGTYKIGKHCCEALTGIRKVQVDSSFGGFLTNPVGLTSVQGSRDSGHLGGIWWFLCSGRNRGGRECWSEWVGLVRKRGVRELCWLGG